MKKSAEEAQEILARRGYVIETDDSSIRTLEDPAHRERKRVKVSDCPLAMDTSS